MHQSFTWIGDSIITYLVDGNMRPAVVGLLRLISALVTGHYLPHDTGEKWHTAALYVKFVRGGIYM